MFFYKSKMKLGVTGLFLFMIGLLTPISSQATSPLPDIFYGKLDNGFQFVLVPLENGDKGRVDVRIQVDVGSVDELDDEIGIAHIIEHMLFHASQKYPQGIAQKMGDNGWVRGQHYNAVTNYERTQYMFSPPNGNAGLDDTLDIIAQMMGSAQFNAEDWKKEQKIVYEEWRGGLGVANRMNQQRVKSIRQGSRYPVRPTIGTEQGILQANVLKQADFYQKWYVPSNMRLLIIGDIDVMQVSEQIRQHFSSLKKRDLPERDYYEPKLDQQLKTTLLQDSQSGSSQVSVVYRLDDSRAKQPDFDGVKQRLINQITLSVVTKQLRRQQNDLPDGVSSLVIRKSDIGKNTVAIGFFANVLPEMHSVGLTALLSDIERLKQYPLSNDDLEETKADLLETADKMAMSQELRDYGDWIQKLTLPLLNGEPYISSQQIGLWAQQILPQITQKEIETNLANWLSAGDRVVQFAVPGNTAFTLPASQHIEMTWQTIANQRLAAPKPKPALTFSPFPDIPFAGKIVAEQDYPQQQTTVWQLSNGDRVVFLNSELAKDKIYFTANSQAGYLSSDVNPWQSQLAVQLIKQNGPRGFNLETFKRWLADNQLSFNAELSKQELQVRGQFNQNALGTYLKIYTALYDSPYIDPISMKESLIAYARQHVVNKASTDPMQSLALLRYGQLPYLPPTISQLNELQAETLLAQFKKVFSTPTTFYLIGHLDKTAVKPLIERYLAGIPRNTIKPATPYLALPGSKTVVNATNIEPRANVTIWSFTPYQWQPEFAANVYVAKQLMQYYLKTALRDEMQEIYRIRTNSTLNEKTQRIETEISFTCAPERYQQLIEKIEAVFKHLPDKLTATQIEQEKRQFIMQEQLKKQAILSLQTRLMLSDRHYGDPSYLSRVDTLADHIDLSRVKQMAGLLFNPDNVVININTPQQEQ